MLLGGVGGVPCGGGESTPPPKQGLPRQTGDIVHCGRNDCRDDCETLLSTATGGSRYNGYVALTGDRQPSDHEAAIF